MKTAPFESSASRERHVASGNAASLAWLEENTAGSVESARPDVPQDPPLVWTDLRNFDSHANALSPKQLQQAVLVGLGCDAHIRAAGVAQGARNVFRQGEMQGACVTQR